MLQRNLTSVQTRTVPPCYEVCIGRARMLLIPDAHVFFGSSLRFKPWLRSTKLEAEDDGRLYSFDMALQHTGTINTLIPAWRNIRERIPPLPPLLSLTPTRCHDM